MSGNIGVIDRRALTASLTGEVRKTYDGNTTATLASGNYVLSGFIGSQSAQITQRSGEYATPDAGSNIAVFATLAPIHFMAGTGTLLANYSLPTSASGPIGVIDAAKPPSGNNEPAKPPVSEPNQMSPAEVNPAQVANAIDSPEDEKRKKKAMPVSCGADMQMPSATLRDHFCIDTRGGISR